MNSFNVAICAPSRNNNDDHFWLCLIPLLNALNREKVKGYDNNGAAVIVERGSIIHSLRYSLAKKAVSGGFSHVLFIDTDQTFPAQIAHVLGRHHKPVVACNIVTKNADEPLPTARSYNPNYWGGDVVYTNPDSSGLDKVWRVGTGIMLIETSVFKKLEKPWFDTKYVAENDEWVGEDWTFCAKCEAAGIPIYIDQDASKRVGHIGPFEFKHSHVVKKDIL